MIAMPTSQAERKEVASTPAFGTALKGAILSTEALASHSKEEIANVGSYLEPFLKKLSELSEDYESEKSGLERSMFEAMNDGSRSTANEIIEQRASARHYVTLVNDFFKRTEELVMQSMQSRRDAERRFATRLIEATQQEYEHVILSMRAEDRKKASFDREENHKKLENCRTAVRMDLAAMLLQQRANLNRKRDAALRDVEERYSKGQQKADEQVRHLEEEVAAAKSQKKQADAELKLRSAKMQSEISDLKEDVKLLQDERDLFETELKNKQNSFLTLTEEANTLRDELFSMRKGFEDEIKDLQRKINRKDDEMNRKEGRLLKRCEEMTVEIEEKTTEIEDLRKRNQQLILDHDELQQNMQHAHQKFTEEAELLEQEKIRHQIEAERMQAVAEEVREELRAKEALSHKLQHQLTEESDRVDRVEAQLKLVDDERATVRRMLSEMRSEAHVWLLDQVYMRRHFSIDPGFDGSDESVAGYEEDFQSLEHRDVQALLHILAGAFAGTYAESRERHAVEKNMAPYFQRLQHQHQEQLQVLVPGPGSQASGAGAAGLKAEGGMAELVEAERLREWNERRQRLEEEHEAHVKQVSAEWRAKSISLAQRLAKTEAELDLPRPEDADKIKALEAQVRTLAAALDADADKKHDAGVSYEELNRWAAVPKKEAVKPKPVARMKSRTGSVSMRASADGSLPAPTRQSSTQLLTNVKKQSARQLI